MTAVSALLLLGGYLVPATLFTPNDGWGFVAFFRIVGFAALILGVCLLIGARALIQHGANRESDVSRPPHVRL
jgi:hypothetical protein